MNDDYSFVGEEDREDFRKALNGFKTNNFISSEKINEKLNAWKKEKLNICIIGETRSGKSNLINTLRGLFPTDLQASKLKITQTTNFPIPYADPNYPNIIFWDTPGYNGIKSASSAPNYMEDMDNFIRNLSFIPLDGKEQFEYIANFF